MFLNNHWATTSCRISVASYEEKEDLNTIVNTNVSLVNPQQQHTRDSYLVLTQLELIDPYVGVVEPHQELLPQLLHLKRKLLLRVSGHLQLVAELVVLLIHVLRNSVLLLLHRRQPRLHLFV